MTLAVYTNGASPSTRPHRRLTGTKHKGPSWVASVRVLRAAIENALGHAAWCGPVTANEVGDTIIDRIGELDAKSLHILALTFATLVRASHRD